MADPIEVPTTKTEVAAPFGAAKDDSSMTHTCTASGNCKGQDVNGCACVDKLCVP